MAAHRPSDIHDVEPPLPNHEAAANQRCYYAEAIDPFGPHESTCSPLGQEKRVGDKESSPTQPDGLAFLLQGTYER